MHFNGRNSASMQSINFNSLNCSKRHGPGPADPATLIRITGTESDPTGWDQRECAQSLRILALEAEIDRYQTSGSVGGQVFQVAVRGMNGITCSK